MTHHANASLPLTHRPNLSLPLGEMSRSDREGRLPPAYAQTKLVSPSGRDVAQRQRGLVLVIFFLWFA